MTTRRKRFRSPRWVLETRQRLRLSWTRWRRSRNRQRMERAVSRHQLLLLELDNQLLLLKELELREQDLVHRLEEMVEAREYRREGLLPPVPPHQLTQRESLDQLLWGVNPPE